MKQRMSLEMTYKWKQLPAPSSPYWLVNHDSCIANVDWTFEFPIIFPCALYTELSLRRGVKSHKKTWKKKWGANFLCSSSSVCVFRDKIGIIFPIFWQTSTLFYIHNEAGIETEEQSLLATFIFVPFSSVSITRMLRHSKRYFLRAWSTHEVIAAESRRRVCDLELASIQEGRTGVLV